MRRTSFFIRSFFLAFALLPAGCKPEPPGKLVIAAAANMQFPMEEIVRAFSKESGATCELVIGSSGKLTAQIMEGAPFDVFISADMKYPEELFRSGHALAGPEIYARGKLVLWSPDTPAAPSMQLLASPELEHIALANPQTAPYGAAAIEFLKYNGLYEKVKPKLVYGESISQTNHFILSGAAGAGITALSAVLAPALRNKGSWMELDTAGYSPVEQGAVVLTNRKDQLHNAKAFYDFLFSGKCKAILRSYGYLMPADD